MMWQKGRVVVRDSAWVGQEVWIAGPPINAVAHTQLDDNGQPQEINATAVRVLRTNILAPGSTTETLAVPSKAIELLGGEENFSERVFAVELPEPTKKAA